MRSKPSFACGKADSHCVDVYTRSLFMSIVQRLSESESF